MSTFFMIVLKIVLGVMVFVGSFLWWKGAPDFVSTPGATHHVPEKSIIFYADTTFQNADGVRTTKQEIWDRIFTLIDGAKRYVLLDMFLFNDFQGKAREETRLLSSELTKHLLEKKKGQKEISMTVITDPINSVYGGVISGDLEELKGSGILTIETNLNKLRDSNLLWSSFWRPFVSWFGNSTEGGWLRHPFSSDGTKVTLRSWFALLNFKANHRKLIVADEQIVKNDPSAGVKMVTIITSANPHDGSSAHGNVALEVRDAIWKDVITAEGEIAKQSGHEIPGYIKEGIRDEEGDVLVTVLRERNIKEKILSTLLAMQKGDTLDIAMFYLSDRDIIREIARSANRGVVVRMILDPNKDAFGFEKNGIPNRPTGSELMRRSDRDISIRWCDTHGEQCHAKLVLGKTASSSFLLLGSANFTRRNLDDLNLETSVFAEREKPFTAFNDAEEYFETLWTNDGGGYTTDYVTYEDTTFWKSSVSRIMEASGLSSF